MKTKRNNKETEKKDYWNKRDKKTCKDGMSVNLVDVEDARSRLKACDCQKQLRFKK
jgi:hypothetical protein